jgi:hypothetical protein
MSTIDITAIASAAAEGRSPFLDRVLNDVVEQTGVEITDDVRDHILTDVLKSEDAWQLAIQQDKFDPDLAGGILSEGLILATSQIECRSTLRLEDARSALYEVIHDRWHCPFPFIFC